MRSETYMGKITLQRGKLTVENRKSREKRICNDPIFPSTGLTFELTRKHSDIRFTWKTTVKKKRIPNS